jgi:hypothetical protein
MRGLGFGRFDVFTRSHSSMPGCGSSGLGYGESTRRCFDSWSLMGVLRSVRVGLISAAFGVVCLTCD